MNYVDPPDVPEGLTLRQYRAAAVGGRGGRRRRPGIMARLRRRLARGALARA